MAIAVFDYGVWSAAYPELAGSVSSGLASSYFLIAETFLINTDCSPVPDVVKRLLLLNMLVAHIAKLFATGAGGSGGVGRVSKATEGSVSVEFDAGSSTSELAAFFSQTPYGFLYWASTAYLRRARYVPAPDPSMEPYGSGIGRIPFGRY